MKRVESARVLGFVQLGFNRPCFLLPIFGGGRNPQVQQVDASDRVAAFIPCSLTPRTKLIPSRDKTRQRVGDRKLYAFQFRSGPAVEGSKTEIQKALQERLQSFARSRYLASEVEAFLSEAVSTDRMVRAPTHAKPERAVLSKSKIVAYLADRCGTPKKTAASFFEELFKLAVKECKGSAGKFVIPNIGTAVKAHRKVRMRRNPQTGEPIKIKANTVVRLRAAKSFKDAVLG